MVKKTKESLRFVEHWFRIMAFRPDLVIDTVGPEDNEQSDYYAEHRHDQAVLTCLTLTQPSQGGGECACFKRDDRAFAEAS